MSEAAIREVLELTQRLLDSITQADWAAYQQLCDPSLTAFEPEAVGQLVQGMEFHRFYFDLGGIAERHNTTLCSPHVRLLGDVAVVAYVRLLQRAGGDGPFTIGYEETRVWHRQDGQWKHVHFHRSPVQQQWPRRTT